jgi:hypothetical protein
MPAWRKSSYSSGESNCVEVAAGAHGAAVRDSKSPSGPMLTFQITDFTAFLSAIRNNELTH